MADRGKHFYTTLKEQFVDNYYEILESFTEYVPDLLISAALLVVGFVCARMFEKLTEKLIDKLDFSLYSAREHDSANYKKHQNIKKYYSFIIGRVVFWAVIAFFLLTVANVLEFKILSEWGAVLMSYMPKFLGGVVVILGGFIVSNLIYNAILRSGKLSNASKAVRPARGVQLIIIFATTIIGLEHIGINSYLLNNILIVVVAASCAGLAIAFSLGSRDLVANIIGAQYVKKHCKVGQKFSTNQVSGDIVEITSISIILKTNEGIMMVPAKLFNTQISSLTLEKGDIDDD